MPQNVYLRYGGLLEEEPNKRPRGKLGFFDTWMIELQYKYGKWFCWRRTPTKGEGRLKFENTNQRN